MFFSLFIFASMTISVSISPIKGILEEIGGQNFQYEVIYPQHSNPHFYEPKPGDILKVKKSEVFVYSGRAEPGADKLCKIAKRCIKMEDLIEGADTMNPHLWLNPEFVSSIVDTIARELSLLDPVHSDTFVNRAKVMKEVIDSFLKHCKNSDVGAYVLLMHRAFLPLFVKLGFNVEVVAKEPGVEPGAGRIKNLLKEFKKRHFVLGVCESNMSCKELRMLAEESNFPVITLNPLYNDGFTYFLKSTLKSISDATNSCE